MKKIVLFALISISLSPLFSLDLAQFTDKQYVLDNLLQTIDRPRAPAIHDNYIIFTANPNVRYTGIAFDFEQYQTIHTFKRLVRQNEDGNNSESFVSFYILEIPQNIQSISYRLVMDGLWTTDPLNIKKEYDASSNLFVSTIALQQSQVIETTSNKKTVKFVYEGESGKKIRLAGNFTNWDPFIYELKETSLGIYELELALPKGTYYYTYYSGIHSFLDETNPERAYTTDGRVASVVTLN